MQSSSTRLKRPLHIWLARLIGFGIVLGYTWIHFLSIKDYQNTLNQGAILDVFLSDEAAVVSLSPEAARKGVAVGDVLLNPEADTVGQPGTEVTFQFQREDRPVREVVFTRKPYDYASYGGVLLGLPPYTVLYFAIFAAFFSVVAALLLCWLRSDDWMAILTAVVLVSLYDAPSQVPWIQAARRSFDLSLFVWLVLFPNGKLAPKWSWVPILLLVPTTMFYLFLPAMSNISRADTINTVIRYSLWLVLLAILIYRYRRVFSSVQRQQSKWIVLPFIAGVLPLVIMTLLYQYYFYSAQFHNFMVAFFINGFLALLITLTLVLGILFSIFRYRLYDVDVFVSRALVYSSLTGILGFVGAATATLADYFLSRVVGDQSEILTVLASALPIAALYNPVRERLQQIVDRRFKPEEVDFENTFIEFTSELSSFFTVKELSRLLSTHAVEQLDVSYASVFLNGKNGDLKHIKTTSQDAGMPEPVLDPQTVETIRNGKLVAPDRDSAHSLVVPLVVPRTRKPTVMGALLLGPRVQGLGYSTDMQKSLKKFGETVGKAFYVAELENRKQESSQGRATEHAWTDRA